MTTATKHTKIGIQVIGLNALNEFISEILINDLPKLAKYVNAKIFKTDDNPTQKFKDFERYKGEHNSPGMHLRFSYYFDNGREYLGIKVNVCISHDGHAQYFDKYIRIGEMQDGQTLLKLYTKDEIETQSPEIKTTHNEREITKTVLQFEEARQTAKDILDSIPYQIRQTLFLDMK